MEGLPSAFTKSASPPTSPCPPCFSLAASVLRAAVNSANGSLYNASTSSSSLPFVSLTLRSSFVSCFPLFLPIYLVSHCFPKTPKPEPSKARTLFHSVFGVLGKQRSEEHTSELQSPCNLVCRLLLEK